MASRLAVVAACLFGAVLLIAAGLTLNDVYHLTDSVKRTELFASFVTNLVGTTVGAGLAAALAFWFALREFAIESSAAETKQLADTAFELHREFNNSETYQARGRADKLLQRYPLPTLDHLYNELPEAETRCVFLVIHFYERLWLSIEHKRVNVVLVPKLFGQIFYWWYFVCFEPQLLALPWNSCFYIRELKTWMDDNTAEADRNMWTSSAIALRKERSQIDPGTEAAAQS